MFNWHNTGPQDGPVFPSSLLCMLDKKRRIYISVKLCKKPSCSRKEELMKSGFIWLYIFWLGFLVPSKCKLQLTLITWLSHLQRIIMWIHWCPWLVEFSYTSSWCSINRVFFPSANFHRIFMELKVMLVGPLRTFLSIWLKRECWVTCYQGELADTMQTHQSVQIYSCIGIGSLTCTHIVCDHKRLISLKKMG